ncbi:MAG TPA: mechanosensitive ion channel family protein [Stellaceae bacterium]|nr:mechanosensitive ion channel family protein [Stellaceae bacterium]
MNMDHFGMMGDRLETVSSQLGAAIRTMLSDAAEAPGRLGHAAAVLTGSGAAGSPAAVLGSFALALIVATLLSMLARWLTGAARRRLARATPDHPVQLALLKVEALLIELVPPASFLIAATALVHWLFWADGLLFTGPDVLRMLATLWISSIAAGWVVSVVLCLPLAVDYPGLRLVPLDDAQAAWATQVLRRIIVLGVGSWVIAAGLYFAEVGSGLPHLILIVATVIIGIICLHALRQIRGGLSGFALHWHRLAMFSVFGLGATWIVGVLLDPVPPLDRVLSTLLVLAVMPAVDGMVILMLRRLRRRLTRVVVSARLIFIPTGENQEMTAVERPFAEDADSAGSADLQNALDKFVGVLHDAASWAIALVATVVLANAWQIDFSRVLGHREARTLLGSGLDAAITLLVGWYAWRLFESGLAISLARGGGGPQTRAQTVRPVLRSVGAVLIGAVALMAGLSALGISIAPLLASAGVLGIAVGFGAQTLVKDLFSGACYLIEDVFRIGDYIEAGTAKGTVEKITFRTVALRHQNGPLHFVPYGMLGSVRNDSRDWVIDKFELPLPTDVDSEAIRKMVKRIGEDMLKNEELAPLIMAPLKAKLYRIDPGIKVFRCKVQTPPGKQFEIRSEAYRQIETALKAAGIPFANNTPQVTVHNGVPVPAPPESSAVPSDTVSAVVQPAAAE